MRGILYNAWRDVAVTKSMSQSKELAFQNASIEGDKLGVGKWSGRTRGSTEPDGC